VRNSEAENVCMEYRMFSFSWHFFNGRLFTNARVRKVAPTTDKSLSHLFADAFSVKTLDTLLNGIPKHTGKPSFELLFSVTRHSDAWLVGVDSKV
jgi:hypothetical protein